MAPVDLDLSAASHADGNRAAPRLTLVDLNYEVIHP